MAVPDLFVQNNLCLLNSVEWTIPALAVTALDHLALI